MILTVIWTNQTSDGLFGRIQVDGNDVCVADTSLAHRILDGTYTARIDLSPRLQYKCPHIQVPLRDVLAGGDAGLRVHKANTPSQSLGCIFPGERIDGDAVDNSKDAFDHLMTLLPHDGSVFDVVILSQLS